MIYAATQIFAKAKKKNMDIYILFVDFAKAFDTVSRPRLCQILTLIGIPPKTINNIRCFYEGIEGRLVNWCKNKAVYSSQHYSLKY